MGFYAKHPFALAPGLEMNAYVAFILVGTLGYTWQEGLGAVFWSGIFFMILTVLNVRTNIIKSIPDNMKLSFSLSVGVFLILIGLKLSEILIFEGITIVGIGKLFSNKAIALYLGLGLILIFQALKYRIAVLLSIILAAIFCNYVGISDGSKPPKLSGEMFSAFFHLDISVLWKKPQIISAILLLFLADFYGSIAKFIGLTINTPIVKEDGKFPRMKKALSVDGIATVIGSIAGTTSITTYVESAVGIGAGGRTGLTAVVCGILMLLSLLITPLLQYVPVVATTGALVIVGLQLCPKLSILKSFSKIDLSVAVLMPLLVVLTFSLEKAMLVGFGIYIVSDLLIKKTWPNPYLFASFILLAIGVLL